jgi:hypothetical protein
LGRRARGESRPPRSGEGLQQPLHCRIQWHARKPCIRAVPLVRQHSGHPRGCALIASSLGGSRPLLFATGRHRRISKSTYHMSVFFQQEPVRVDGNPPSETGPCPRASSLLKYISGSSCTMSPE